MGWSTQRILTAASGVFIGFMLSNLLVKVSILYHFLPRSLISSDPHNHQAPFVNSGQPLLTNVSLHTHLLGNEEGTLAGELYKKTRILCWVLTGPENHEARAKHVKATWGQRCNKLIFMSSESDANLPAVKLEDSAEGRDNLWGKTKRAFKYVHDNHLEDAEWFLKADDDTYAIMENMRFMLEPYNASQPLYFGCKFSPFIKQGYMSGGAGYLLSKEALVRFVNEGLHAPDEVCKTSSDDGAEDVEMGKCMENLGVIAGDSRDNGGHMRFLPFIPEHHLTPHIFGPDFWWYKYSFYPIVEGMRCCSDTAVSFHYMAPNQMYVMEYLVYHVKPYGLNQKAISSLQK